MVKNLPADAGDARDPGLIPELGRSPGGGNGYPLQYSSLENCVDRGAWQAVHGVSESDATEHTRVSSLTISQMWLKLLCTWAEAGTPCNYLLGFSSCYWIPCSFTSEPKETHCLPMGGMQSLLTVPLSTKGCLAIF